MGEATTNLLPLLPLVVELVVSLLNAVTDVEDVCSELDLVGVEEDVCSDLDVIDEAGKDDK